MRTARILNVIALAFFGVSLMFASAVLIYISIALLLASMVYWRFLIRRQRDPDQKRG